MIPLWLAASLSLALFGLAGLLGWRLGRFCRLAWRRLLLAELLCAGLAWLHALHDSVWLARLFPVAEVLYLGKGADREVDGDEADGDASQVDNKEARGVCLRIHSAQ